MIMPARDFVVPALLARFSPSRFVMGKVVVAFCILWREVFRIIACRFVQLFVRCCADKVFLRKVGLLYILRLICAGFFLYRLVARSVMECKSCRGSYLVVKRTVDLLISVGSRFMRRRVTLFSRPRRAGQLRRAV